MGELGFCTIHDWFTNLSIQLIVDITTDTGLPYLLTRFLHNKFAEGIYLGARCYILYLDSGKLSLFISPFLYPLILVALIESRWRKFLWLIFLTMPIFFIMDPLKLDLSGRILIYRIFMMTFAVAGFIKAVLFVKRKSSGRYEASSA